MDGHKAHSAEFDRLSVFVVTVDFKGGHVPAHEISALGDEERVILAQPDLAARQLLQGFCCTAVIKMRVGQKQLLDVLRVEAQTEDVVYDLIQRLLHGAVYEDQPLGGVHEIAGHPLRTDVIHVSDHPERSAINRPGFRKICEDLVLQVLLTIPVAIVLPSFLVHRYLASAVPKLFSLRDDVSLWHKKAIRLIAPEEAVRFLIGLVPLPFTEYGVLTSPVTYLLYTLVYVNPTDKYEEVMVNHHASLIDTAVFLLIYLIYFALYNFFLFRKFKKEVIRQHTYLEGCLAEKQKSENYYR